jgi:hypothetical protein
MNSKFTAPNILVGVSLLAVLSAACTAIFRAPWSDRLRAKVVKAALSEPANAPRVTEYWRDVLSPSDFLTPPKEWCGAFVLWALHQAGLAKDVLWKIGVGFISPENLPKTLVPKAGDIAYFSKNDHQAIVKSVNNDGTVTIINGNGTGGLITTSNPKMNDVTAFYNIQPLIDKVAA